MAKKYACYGGFSKMGRFLDNFKSGPVKTCKHYSEGGLFSLLFEGGKRELPYDWKIDERTIFNIIKPSRWKLKNMCRKKENVSSCFDVLRQKCEFYEQTDCFIATEIYGQDAEETNLLRGWRDEKLNPTLMGRLAVRCYYKVSPGVASLLRRYPRLKGPIKSELDSFVHYLKK